MAGFLFGRYKIAGFEFKNFSISCPKKRYRSFTVRPDLRTYKILRDSMRQVYQEICRLRNCSTTDESLIAKIELLPELFIDITGDAPRSQLEAEDALISGLEQG
ncbi:MAG: hypothetical protein RR619_09555 [Raoultibacter sp.]